MKATQAGSDPHEPPESEYATRQEVEAAIAALTPVEKKKLMVAARFWCKKYWLQGTTMAPEDLLQDAVVRSLEVDEPRRWRKGVVGIVKHLDRSMESIAGHHRETLQVEAKTQEAAYPEAGARGAKSRRPLCAATDASKHEASDEVEALRAFFGDDTIGFSAVMLKAQEMDPGEIQKELGISEAEWETLRKRVRRKLAQYVKESGENQ